jgi:hypothetical protein
LKIALKYACAGGVPRIVGKILTRATTFLLNSFQSKVFTRSYGHPKWQESEFKEFWDSQLGSCRKNDIWVQPPGLIMENIKKEEGGGFPKFRLW